MRRTDTLCGVAGLSPDLEWKAINMQYASRSVPGLVRSHNEDRVLSCAELGLWVI